MDTQHATALPAAAQKKRTKNENEDEKTQRDGTFNYA